MLGPWTYPQHRSPDGASRGRRWRSEAPQHHKTVIPAVDHTKGDRTAPRAHRSVKEGDSLSVCRGCYDSFRRALAKHKKEERTREMEEQADEETPAKRHGPQGGAGTVNLLTLVHPPVTLAPHPHPHPWRAPKLTNRGARGHRPQPAQGVRGRGAAYLM